MISYHQSRSIVSSLLACAVMCLLFAWPAYASPQNPSSSRKLTLAPLKVGVILPLSGGWASWGERIRQGILISAESLQHPLEFRFDDEGTCEPHMGVRAARKFFADGVKVLIIGCVATTKALLAEAERRGVLLISAGLLDRQSFASGAMVVSFATQVGTEALYLAEYIAAEGYQRIALVRPLEAFGEELANVLTETLRKKGLQVVFDDSDSFSTNDFGPTALRIQREKPDVVVINLGESQQEAFVKRVRASGSTVPIVSTYGLESNFTSPATITSLEGITYTYPYNAAAQSREKLQFDARFTARYGTELMPNANVYFVHDGLTLLDQALNNCATADTRCLFQFFAHKGKSQGISGQVTFHSDGSTDRPYKMKRVVQGNFTWLETLASGSIGK